MQRARTAGIPRIRFCRYATHYSDGDTISFRSGIGIDGDSPDAPIVLFKEVGKVAALRKHIADAVATPVPAVANGNANGNGHTQTVDMDKVFFSQTSMAHTRWATHGVPSPLNCHPHVSDIMTEFSLVHSQSEQTLSVNC